MNRCQFVENHQCGVKRLCRILGVARSSFYHWHRASVTQSMSAIDSTADNALAESFNATCKRETLQGRRTWNDEHEAHLPGPLPLAAPLQHHPTPLPPHAPQPHRLRASTPNNIYYAGQSRMTRVQDQGLRPGLFCTVALYLSPAAFSGTPASHLRGADIHWIALQPTGLIVIPAGLVLVGHHRSAPLGPRPPRGRCG